MAAASRRRWSRCPGQAAGAWRAARRERSRRPACFLRCARPAGRTRGAAGRRATESLCSPGAGGGRARCPCRRRGQKSNRATGAPRRPLAGYLTMRCDQCASGSLLCTVTQCGRNGRRAALERGRGDLCTTLEPVTPLPSCSAVRTVPSPHIENARAASALHHLRVCSSG